MQTDSIVAHRPRSGRSLLLLGGVQALTAGGIWAAASGGQMLRAFALGSVALTMLTALAVSLEAGLLAMILFEPFRGFLRRLQYLIVPYSTSEPIHVLTPIVTVAAFTLLLSKRGIGIFRETPLAAGTSILGAICFLQVFNPLQGNLYVGLTGAMYFLVPMAWFYFAGAAGAEFVPRVLRLIVILATVTSLYGVYQLVIGYPFFEQVWLDNTDLYNSISVYNVQRALATFSSAEEWGRYVQIGCLIAAGLGMTRSEGNKRFLWFSAAGGLLALIAVTGQRTSIFGLMAGLAILMLTGAENLRSAAARLMLMLTPLVLMYALVKPLTDDDGMNSSDNIDAMMTHTSKGVLDPTKEDSLQIRLDTWSVLLTQTLPSNPIGVGLGATTPAATRGHADHDLAIDNHFLSLALTAGVPASILLAWILFRAMFFCIRALRLNAFKSRQRDTWRIMLALMSSLIINNFFGNSFSIYSVAPLGWLIVGWVSANSRTEDPNVEQRRGLPGGI